MRWNCPHCNTALGISDEKLGTGWSFSRCYKCSGYALVRRSDINLIKVDRAPVDENVILSEAHDEPAAMMSEEATRRLNEHLGKPVIRPGRRQRQPENTKTRYIPGSVDARGVSLPNPVRRNPNELPDPLPENPPNPVRRRTLSSAIAFAATVAVTSGIYLYVQGQRLWEKARIQTTEVAPLSTQVTAAQERPAQQLTPSTAIPEAAGLKPAIAIVDQVRHEAMAPIRENPGSEQKTFMVQPLKPNVKLRGGPGLEFPVLGTARMNTNYSVIEWRERWFKISMNDKTARQAAPQAVWIRNDLVRLVRSEN